MYMCMCRIHINVLCFWYYNNDSYNILFLTTVYNRSRVYEGLQNYAHLGHGLP